jgi:hypothetical protein
MIRRPRISLYIVNADDIVTVGVHTLHWQNRRRCEYDRLFSMPPTSPTTTTSMFARFVVCACHRVDINVDVGRVHGSDVANVVIGIDADDVIARNVRPMKVDEIDVELQRRFRRHQSNDAGVAVCW